MLRCRALCALAGLSASAQPWVMGVVCDRVGAASLDAALIACVTRLPHPKEVAEDTT